MTAATRRSMWPIVAALVLLPVLYVLSIGPATELWRRGYLPHIIFTYGYRPVTLLAKQSSWSEGVLARYITACTGRRAEWLELGGSRELWVSSRKDGCK